MRSVTVAVGGLALFATGVSGAEGRTLHEILRDKGVISQEEYQDAAKKSDHVYYRPGRGITLESEEGNFVAHLGGRLQARYSFVDVDDPVDDNVSSFSIRRMKVWLRGHVFTPRLGYKYQQNHGEVEDAFATYEIFKPLEVGVGQMKAPQGRQELTSSGSQMFVDRSLANDTFNLGRDIGIAVSGSFANHIFEYSAGLFNGNGPGEGNPETEHMVAARVDVNPLGRFKMDEPSWGEASPLLNIGASWAYSQYGPADMGSFSTDNDVLDKALDLDGLDADGDGARGTAADFSTALGAELDVNVYTVNLHAKWLGASVGGEYYLLRAAPDKGDDFDADGYYLQGGYHIQPIHLELAVRYSAIESDDSNATERFDKSELQLGVNYYFQKHLAKLQADYTQVRDDENQDADDRMVRVQAQLIF